MVQKVTVQVLTTARKDRGRVADIDADAKARIALFIAVGVLFQKTVRFAVGL